MTTAITPDPAAAEFFPAGDIPQPAPKAPASGRSDSTSLRVGVATLWLSVIVLLPLAAIAWQAIGGGWRAFSLAVTSHAALRGAANA